MTGARTWRTLFSAPVATGEDTNMANKRERQRRILLALYIAVVAVIILKDAACQAARKLVHRERRK